MVERYHSFCLGFIECTIFCLWCCFMLLVLNNEHKYSYAKYLCGEFGGELVGKYNEVLIFIITIISLENIRRVQFLTRAEN